MSVVQMTRRNAKKISRVYLDSGGDFHFFSDDRLVPLEANGQEIPCHVADLDSARVVVRILACIIGKEILSGHCTEGGGHEWILG